MGEILGFIFFSVSLYGIFKITRWFWRIFRQMRQTKAQKNKSQHQPQSQQRNYQPQYPQWQPQTFQTDAPINIPLPNSNVPSQSQLDAKQKGDDFEKFMVKKFSPRYYKIKEWRGDKFVDGLYAETNKDPDIVLEYNWNGRQQQFAIECKYRSSFYQGAVEWAKERQVLHYQAFMQRTNIPTFIVLGMGGTPTDPQRVYIIPVLEVNKHILTEYELRPFLRKTQSDFFFDLNNLKLA
jgi:hypothetical protein